MAKQKPLRGRVFLNGVEVHGKMPDEWLEKASKSISDTMTRYYAEHLDEYEKFAKKHT